MRKRVHLSHSKKLFDFPDHFNARKRVGLQGKKFHDFRRTMTRHLRDAGVDDPTSMKITGHKTRSVFDRYNIRDERDVKNAADKLSRLA